ncbi:MAG: cytochrome C oxidase subunit IV family protein [Dehalococcoidia bacterium]|nr:cytochrome C oxidase subunit IV family protein [Dehalococcoidia bacterium]
MADRSQPRQGAHPTPQTYLKVATILVILTAAEVAVLYIDALRPVFLPLFLVLSVAKFCLVVMFYMHLKFDSRLFSWVFVGGLLLAVAVGIVLMSLFQVVSTVANPREEGEVALVSEVEPEIDTPVLVEIPAENEQVSPPETGQAETPAVGGLVAMGQEIFMVAPANVGPQALWCNTCHQIEGLAAGLIGPDLTHIATDAGTRRPGMSAEQYIRESIANPEVFVPTGVERATAGLMTEAITSGLTDEQVDALVAYLMTLE